MQNQNLVPIISVTIHSVPPISFEIGFCNGIPVVKSAQVAQNETEMPAAKVETPTSPTPNANGKKDD
jgi:hypothetical protein